MLLVVVPALAGLAAADPGDAGVMNGGFESGGFTGWTQVNDPPDQEGRWSVYNGTSSPLSGMSIAAPPEGSFAATTDQFGPGAHVLFQDIVVPASGNATLSLLLYYENRAGAFADPDTLNTSAGANQQYRVEILRANASPTSMAGTDVLATILRTNASASPTLAPARFCADLSPYAGTSVRLRLAQIDNLGYFQASVDDVRVAGTCVPTPPPPPPQIDLAVTALHTPASGDSGSRILVHGNITNLGANVTTRVNFAWLVDGATVQRGWTFTSIPSGGSINVTASLVLPAAGTHEIRLVVDPDGNLTETDETNNALAAPIEVLPSQTDLFLAGLRLFETPVEGRGSTFSVVLGNAGNKTAADVETEWHLDGAFLTRWTWNGGVGTTFAFEQFGSLPPLASGNHTLRGVIDPRDNITESDESNNTASLTFFVRQSSNASIDLVDLRPVRVAQTELGEVRHPIGRFEATMRTCNAGPAASDAGFVTLQLRGGAPGRPIAAGATSLPSRGVGLLAPGACADDTFQFDAPGAVGDFTLTATLLVANDGSFENNADSISSFRLVGDLGGVVVPVPQPPTVDPIPIVNQTQRQVQNATRDLQNVSRLLGPIQNATSVVVAQVNATLGALGEGPENGTRLAQSAVCIARDLCNTTSGDPGIGAFHPCTVAPNGNTGLAPWLVWYGTQTARTGSLDRPDNATRPASLNVLWNAMPAHTALPASAPACISAWGVLGTSSP